MAKQATSNIILIRDILVPRACKICDKVQDEELCKVLRTLTTATRRLSITQLDELEILIAKQTILADDEKADLLDLVRAWYFANSCSTPSQYTLAVARKTADAIAKLGERADFDASSERKNLLRNASIGMLNMRNGEEVSQWIDILKELHQEFPEQSRLAINVLQERLQVSIWSQMSTNDLSRMTETLETVVRLKRQLGELFNLPLVESGFEELMISQIREALRTQQNLDQARQALRSLHELHVLHPTADTFSSRLTELSTILSQSDNQHEVSLNITPDYNQVVEPIYSESSLRELGHVSGWSDLEKLRETPEYLLQRGPVEVVVWKARIRSSNEPVAVKVYKSRDLRHINIYHREVEHLDKLAKAGLSTFLAFYGAFFDTLQDDSGSFHRFNIVMEYCPKDMNKVLAQGPLAPPQFTQMFKELVGGFAYLQSAKVYHQDVKPQNILLTDRGQFKIADFNVSKSVDPSLDTAYTGMHSIQGTEGYFSPELKRAWIEYKQGQGPKTIRYSPVKSDVFSLGLTFLQAVTGQSMANQNNPEHEDRLKVQIITSPAIAPVKDLLLAMLDFDVSRRPTFTEVQERINF